ncbi:asparagine synthase (glutamine-hydrolyzing) [Microbulbifer sp. GL-2]|uniref:asparagine synthase (glutamine-hydrolyzing) n=1 Tax=Microbulbifer sp. GL-2 TaxID=2591606 RepID=UPI00116253D9|nr:asparagine synthase (glutamine-hydrolyzing) [Microbulbifer sp. GL-2]BBM03635.1 asparagine synthetase B [Microbulbifer sp. GL-2]
MCGIAGVFNHCRNNYVEEQLLINMAAIQAHRGPDGYGYISLKNLGLGMSHVRLAIIDLDIDRGKQPYISKDSNYYLVHNGETYDYQKIRAQLSVVGVKFESKSDSEIVLHLCSKLGVNRAARILRGEFAFAIYDKYEDCLWLVRDRFGIKPLYWTETHDGIIFGSELKAIFSHPSTQPQFTGELLYHQLIQVIIPGTTAFKGVNQVNPGCILKCKRVNNSIEVSEEKYWDISFSVLDKSSTEDEEYYIEGIRENLINAVQLRMNSDVPVGCYVSGGIDSCSILGIASELSQTPLKTFTIGFDSVEYDETQDALSMVHKTDADPFVLNIQSEHLYKEYAKTIWHTERTIDNCYAVAKYIMSKKVYEHDYKVVLTGEGADELFSGYPFFRQDMYKYGLNNKNPKKIQKLLNDLEKQNEIFKGCMFSCNALSSPGIEKKIGFTPSFFQAWLQYDPLVTKIMDKELSVSLKDYDAGDAIVDALDLGKMAGRHPLDKAQYMWIKTMLEGQILTCGGDRVDMANSIEARPPFLDHHLAEFAATIPPNLKINGTTEKYILRKAMKELLPKKIYNKQKFAFMAPPGHSKPTNWVFMKNLTDRFLGKKILNDSGLFDHKEVKKIIKRYEDPTINFSCKAQLDTLINNALSVQILHHYFVSKNIPKLAYMKAQELGWLVG